jgi:hypothetical protein
MRVISATEAPASYHENPFRSGQQSEMDLHLTEMSELQYMLYVNVHIFLFLSSLSMDLFFSLSIHMSNLQSKLMYTHVLDVRYEYGFVSVEEAWDTIAASYATRVAGFTGARFPHLLFRRMFPPSVVPLPFIQYMSTTYAITLFVCALLSFPGLWTRSSQSSWFSEGTLPSAD